MPSESADDKPRTPTVPPRWEPLPDLPRKLPTKSGGLELATASGFCGLMLDAAAWSFMSDKSGDYLPALTPICLVAGVLLTGISVILFAVAWLKHKATRP
jgi:hypothetical protein